MDNVSKGTLRRLYRRFTRDKFAPFHTLFKAEDSFKKWVRRNKRAILKYYEAAPGFTYPAAALLGV